MNRISTRSESNSQPIHSPAEEASRVHKPAAKMGECGRSGNTLKRERLQRDILNGIPDPAWMKNNEGVFLEVNRAWCDFAQMEAADVIGKTASELFGPDIAARFHQQDALVFKTKEPSRIEEHLSNDQNKAWFDTVITPLLDEQREVTAIIGIARNITERKRMEEQFLRNQRLESIGSLAGGIAHDLNNILGPIMMSASMLEEDLPDKTSKDLIAIIQEAAQRGADIVNQVLTFAKGAKGEHKILQPRALVGQVERILKEILPKAITFKASLPEGLWNVTGDLTQLHQVFINLCVNARDAMPQGGTLSLSAKNFTACNQFASKFPDAKPGRYVKINVSDSGTGIPREIVEKIFDPFFTTKPSGKGTGLGLSTVLGIVKSHGGFVTIDSKLGKGSKFSVYFPATAKTHVPAKPPEHCRMPPGKGELILVVDDEVSICKMARTILTKTGYRILTASGGKEALELFKKHGAAVKAVLTDLAMPVMDGVALTRALKEINPSLAVIASTGQACELRYKELQNLNVSSYLSKPYSAHQLLTIVHQALGGTAQLLN